MKISHVIIFLLCVMFVGCATVLQGKKQSFTIVTDPPGAVVSVDRTLEQFTTPAEISLKRKHEYVLTVEKEGYQKETIHITRHVSAVTAGNVILGGLCGIMWDGITGGAYELKGDQLNIKLKKI